MLFSRRKRLDRDAAERLYEACVRAARQPEFHRFYGVPDTLQGRFEMVSIHLFAVLNRLMHEPGDDPELARLLAESFVADMDGAFRDMGVGDLRVPKRMTTLYRSFGGRMAAYRSALQNGGEAIVQAVARNVFPDGADPAHALHLAGYLESAAHALMHADLDGLRRGDAPFPAPSPVAAELMP
jgi:cytochrome b pre-mRNA-processing protein 3